MSITNTYTPLEQSSISSLGITPPNFNGAAASFASTTSYIWVLCFSAIVIASFYRYAEAGIVRIPGSEVGIKKSNEILKKVTYGLLGVFSLWLILATVNRDMLRGEIDLGGLRANGGGVSLGGVTNVSYQGSGSGTTAPCGDVEAVKASVLPGGAGICGNTVCTILSGCSYQQYQSIIQSESNKLGVNWKLIVVTMCKESGGNMNAQHRNENGSYDCGLMQINQQGPCDSTVLDPQTNIARGVSIMNGKLNSSSVQRTYQNIPVEAGAFASYNCCANGTVPNAESGSCKTSDGWPIIPKWACPLDPGVGAYNMCGVKSYACQLSACLKNL